jgi:sugar (pentulose or hexulose) kinase
MVTDYINYRLTGNLVTNPSTATTFYLADQEKGAWLTEVLDKLGIAEEKLPKILPTGTKIGKIRAETAKITGLAPNIPVIAGSFDHPGAARATGTLEEGDLLLSCGTSWVGFYPSRKRDVLISLEMLVDPFLKDGGIWGGMFSLPRIGSNIDYLIKKWIDDSQNMYKIFNETAESSACGAKGLLINPMEDIKKDFSRYGKPEISMAIMEGTAKLMKKQMDYFSGCGLKNNRIVMAGGPTQSTLWMKILNDILDADISIAGSHAGAKGAAIMAGIGIGTYKDEFDAFRKINGG